MKGSEGLQAALAVAPPPGVWRSPTDVQGLASGLPPGPGACLVSSQSAGLTVAETGRCQAAALAPVGQAVDSTHPQLTLSSCENFNERVLAPHQIFPTS